MRNGIALFLALFVCSPLWGSSTGGTGKSVIQPAGAEPRPPASIKRPVAVPPTPPRPPSLPASSQGGAGPERSVIQRFVTASPYPPTPGALYLAPNGTDTGNTTCSFTQPCQTIAHVQSLVSAGSLVLLRGGFYYNSSPITLTASGMLGSPIVYAAYPYETPIIVGAQPVAGWTDASSNCAGASIMNCWKAPIPTSWTDFEHMIYVPANWPASYVAYTMSRRSQSFNTPSSYNLNTGPVAVGTTGCTPSFNGYCLDRVDVNTSDVSTLTTTPYNAKDIKYYNFRNWNVDALRISGVSQSGATTELDFTGSTLGGNTGGFVQGDRYLLVNSKEYFQANATPGTFYVDCGSTACVDQSTLANATVYSYGGGIAMGPGVAYTTAYDYNNTVQYNNFHDIGEGVITDFGCVHFANRGGASLGLGGDTFQNNICHDITHALNDPGISGGIGLYVDNNSQNLTVQYNLVYRTTDALFLSSASSSCPTTSAGCDNLVSNNILAYSYEGPIKRGGNDLLLYFTFKHNIVYYDTAGPQWLYHGSGDWDCNSTTGACTRYFAFYSNDYWSPNLGVPSFITTGTGGGTWPFGMNAGDWQDTDRPYPGEDIQADGKSISMHVDPMFMNPTFPVDDYTVNNGTLATEIGFDTGSFAPTYKAGRNNPAIFPNFTPTTFPVQLLSPFKF